MTYPKPVHLFCHLSAISGEFPANFPVSVVFSQITTAKSDRKYDRHNLRLHYCNRNSNRFEYLCPGKLYVQPEVEAVIVATSQDPVAVESLPVVLMESSVKYLGLFIVFFCIFNVCRFFS